MPGEDPNYSINGSFGAPENRFSIDFGEAKTKFYLSLYCNGDNSYLYVIRKEMCKFKTDNENVNFPSQFCLGSTSNKFEYVNVEEVSFKRNVYGVSIDYDAIDKSLRY